MPLLCRAHPRLPRRADGGGAEHTHQQPDPSGGDATGSASLSMRREPSRELQLGRLVHPSNSVCERAESMPYR